jgi:hypothetical protein
MKIHQDKENKATSLFVSQFDASSNCIGMLGSITHAAQAVFVHQLHQHASTIP